MGAQGLLVQVTATHSSGWGGAMCPCAGGLGGECQGFPISQEVRGTLDSLCERGNSRLFLYNRGHLGKLGPQKLFEPGSFGEQ